MVVVVFLKKFVFLFAAVVLAASMPTAADPHPEWTQAVPPFRIAGNLYYVGSADLAAYLIVTPQGNILINSNLTSSPKLIRASIEALGFRFADTKILLISHAHYDHCAGSAEVKRLTGAKYMVMDADVPAVESGGRADFAFGKDRAMYFPLTKVDRTLHDGEQVALGGTVLTAHKTAGHTPGTTTWTLDETEGGKMLHVVIVGSPNVLSEYRLAGKHPSLHSYPGIARDFERQFAVLRGLPCDVFLGSHGSAFGFTEKLARQKSVGASVWVDPDGYRRYVADREAAFQRELKRQSTLFSRN